MTPPHFVLWFAGAKWLCLMFGICSHTILAPHVTGQKTFRTVYEWSQLEFDYADDEERQVDIVSGTFNPGAPAPIDVDVYYGRKCKNFS